MAINIKQLLPKDNYDALVASASAPSASNAYATLADIPAPTPPVAIIDDRLPRGTGTTTEDGTWSNVGNDIYPETTGSNIGDATHRIGTLFMASTVDHLTDLNLVSGANTLNTFEVGGNVDLAKTGGEFRSGLQTTNYIQHNNQGQLSQISTATATNTWAGFFSYNDVTTAGVQVGLFTNRFGTTGVRYSHVHRWESWTGTMGSSSTERMRLSTTGNLSLGTAQTGARIRVRGAGNTFSTNLFYAETLSGQAKHVLKDNGQTATAIGFAAAPQTTIGHYYLTSGALITTGHSFNAYSATTTAVAIGQFSNTPNGLFVTGASNSTGIVRTGAFDNKSTAGTQHVGVYAFARNGSQYDLGVDAVVGGGSATAPSIYAAGVRGSAASNLDTLQYGGYFNAGYNNNAIAYTKDVIGVHAQANGQNSTAGSTGDVIAAKFQTAGIAGTGNRIALLVPATNNNGTVVLNLDAPIANTYFSLASSGNDNTTNAAVIQNSSASNLLTVRDDGLTQLNTSVDTLLSAGDVTNLISQRTITDHLGFYASHAVELTYSPALNSTTFVRANSNAFYKTGSTLAGTVMANQSYFRNNGTGTITSAYGHESFIENSAAGNITNFWGNSVQLTQEAAGTITNYGGYRVLFREQSAGTITNMYGFKTEQITSTVSAVSNTYGFLCSNNQMGSVFNWGFRQEGSQMNNQFQGNLGLGSSSATTGVTRLNVQAFSNTLSSFAVRVTNLSNALKFSVNGAGQTTWHAGGTAGPQATMGHYIQTTGYATGMAVYGRTGNTSAFSVQQASSGNNCFAINAGFQGTPTGTATVIYGFQGADGATTSIGVHGLARNGSTNNYGVYGSIGGGWSAARIAAPPADVRAVYGAANAGVDTIQYGVYGAGNSSVTVATKNMIGVFGLGTNKSLASGSTSTAIGGQFRTQTVGAGEDPKNIALHVPLTSNDGTVVLGANARSGNSMLEVTGDIEVIGAGGTEGLILEAPDTTRYRVTVNNAGGLVILAA